MVAIKQRLEWLEFGRGLAALVVVFSHSPLANAPPELFDWTAEYAVSFFFVLSGFIILHVHFDDIGRPKNATPYAWRRVIRIFPTYWIILFLDIALHLLAHNSAQSLRPASIVHEAFLLPGGEPIIKAAWTLRHELLFYGLFLVLILNVRVGVFIFCGWFASILYILVSDGSVYPISDVSRAPMQTLFSPINLLFFVGMAFAAALRRMKLRTIIEPPRVSSWMGKISYPLYLCHMTIYFVAGGIFKRIGLDVTWPIHFAFVLATSVLVAWMISTLLEKPLLSKLQQWGPKRKRLITAE